MNLVRNAVKASIETVLLKFRKISGRKNDSKLIDMLVDAVFDACKVSKEAQGIPVEFFEEALSPKVIIMFKDGELFWVKKSWNVSVEIRDYDLKDRAPSALDSHGPFVLSVVPPGVDGRPVVLRGENENASLP